MPSIFGNETDGIINSGNVSGYTTARNTSTGTVQHTSDASDSFAPGLFKFGSRGGGSSFRFERYFVSFDTSGITVAPSSANLKFTIHADPGSNAVNLIAVKSDAFNGSNNTLEGGDFNNLDVGTPYTAEIDSESGSAGDRISVALNSTALNDIASSDLFILALINHAHDFTNSEPSSTGNYVQGIRFADFSGTSSDPEIDYVAGSAPSGPANLTSYNGIAKASITNINGITMANITTLNGIS